MNRRRFLAGRVAWSVFVVWLLLTATFLVTAAAPDPNAAPLMWGLSPDEAEAVLEGYREQMQYDEPLFERYLHWMTEYATLRFGESYVRGRSVAAVLSDALPVTAAYLLPSLLLSVVLGVAGGAYSTVADRLPARVIRAGVLSALAVPVFLLGEALVLVAVEAFEVPLVWTPDAGFWSGQNLLVLAAATAVLTVNLVGVQARYARALTAEYAAADFVKTFRANGAGLVAVLRHAVRNASVPLVSLFLTRALTVLFLSVYLVEAVFGLPGLGTVTLSAFESRDVAVILATTFLAVVVGVVGNLLQDVAYAFLDPRVEGDD
ncbi:ABC transporter permease [Candidatus Halobonum tyrrellensis]|uniref:Peptide ABC transporter permease n=1 Tax=Candidatus Halobonum tyrrellensis G22 TaxID=1324957 RepID=V4J121_9EURY|nr:ABC transporter permease [Candidatus Halobonum tyrrellensis]ESP89152.1 peptide ABC transporter permease [Candidatus Halobonum tyrrellensis G22]